MNIYIYIYIYIYMVSDIRMSQMFQFGNTVCICQGLEDDEQYWTIKYKLTEYSSSIPRQDLPL